MSKNASFHEQIASLVNPQILADAMMSEHQIKIAEAELEAQAQGKDLTSSKRSTLERQGSAARLRRDNTNYNPRGTGNDQRREEDKTYEEGFRDITISKGNAAEEAVTSVFRTAFKVIDNQTDISLGNDDKTRSDLIARNAAQDGIICGIPVKKGESIGAEIKCGDERYLRRQIRHIDSQLSGYDMLDEPVDHKIIIVSADIERLTKNALIVDENGKVTLSPKANPNSYAARFMKMAGMHGAVVYEMPFYAVDMTYSYLQSFEYIKEPSKAEFKDSIPKYKVYESEKIPGLEAIVNEEGRGWIQLDNEVFCDIFTDAKGIQINKDPDHFSRIGNNGSLEDRIHLALEKCENYLQNYGGRNGVINETRILDGIKPQFTSHDIEVLTYPTNTMPRIRTLLDMTETGLKDACLFADLDLLSDRSIQDIIYSPERPKVWLTTYFQDNYATLTVEWKGHESEIPLPPTTQAALIERWEDRMEISGEDYIAKKLQSYSIYPTAFHELRINEDNSKTAQLELRPKFVEEILVRSNVAQLLGIQSTDISKLDLKIEATLYPNNDIRVNLLSDRIEGPVAVPFTDKEKLVLKEYFDKTKSMTKNNDDPKQKKRVHQMSR